jgi:hypothetical protein
MGAAQMHVIAHLIDEVLAHVEILDERQYRLDPAAVAQTRLCVQDLCTQFPMQ